MSKQPQSLPDPAYRAGAEGLLGEDCWTRAQVLALLAAERESCALLADAMKMGRPGHTAGHDVVLYSGDVGQAIREPHA